MSEIQKKSKLEYLINKFKKLAVPISSDYIEDIHSDPIRKAIPKNRQLLVYHGTSTEKLKNIISHGSLDPSESAKGKSWEDSSPGIYVTTKMTGFSSSAELYARKAANVHGGEPIILELSIPFGQIEIDPDDIKIIEETQSVNEAGKVQGRILQSIPINKITKVYELSGFSGRHMESYSLPNYIKKLLKEEDLDQEDKSKLKEKLPLTSKKEPRIDIESTLADDLTNWHDNIFPPHQTGKNNLSTYDNALLIAFKFKNKNALEALKEFCEILNNDISEIENYPDEYKPKSWESLHTFLNRFKKS